MKVLVRLKPKESKNLNTVLLILKKLNIDTSNFFKSLKEKNFFEFYCNKSAIYDLKDEIEENAYLEILDIYDDKQDQDLEVKNSHIEVKSPYAFFTLATLDVFILLFVVENVFGSLKIKYFIDNLVGISKISDILLVLFKIAFSFLYFRGLIDISQSTLIGRLFGIKIYGSNLNTVSIFLLPIVGFYFINTFGNVMMFKFLGMFLMTFYVIATFMSFEYLGISLKRERC